MNGDVDRAYQNVKIEESDIYHNKTEEEEEDEAKFMANDIFLQNGPINTFVSTSTLPKYKSKSTHLKGDLLTIVACAFFSISNIIVKKWDLLKGSDHLGIVYLLTLIIFPFIMFYLKEAFYIKNNNIWLTVRAFANIFGCMLLYIGLQLLPPSDCSTIGSTQIIITAIIARVFLKEKLSLAHLISTILTMTGMLFIIKPSFLFSNSDQIVNLNKTEMITVSFNQTQLITTTIENKNNSSNNTFIIGILANILSTTFFSVNNLITRKLCNQNIHWSLQIIYTAYIGFPMCFIVSLISYFTDSTRKEYIGSHLPELWYNFLYSMLSGVFCLLGLICLNLAFIYEEATKVSIIKSIDVLFAFTFQAIILNIFIDDLTIFGSAAILIGSFIVCMSKLIENHLIEKNRETKNKHLSIMTKLLTSKF
jgi:drug/metabolite transporter (DMT)-like permease